jgi:hypothetical protein
VFGLILDESTQVREEVAVTSTFDGVGEVEVVLEDTPIGVDV